MRQRNYNLDLNHLRTMTGDDPEFLNEILMMVLEQAPSVLFQSGNLLENGKFDLLASLVHRFKSSLSVLGNAEVLTVVGELELAAKDNDIDTVRVLYTPFVDMVNQVVSQVEAEVQLPGAA